ncbi:MAG: transporter substrate-binding domain-containing protein, partial [Erysipelotrichaceae bacterium]|nr:transporter substrate-binding domain-containing protein [Erysipelotrichaceae bacterium]
MKSVKVLMAVLGMALLVGCSSTTTAPAESTEVVETADQLAAIKEKGVMVVACEGVYAPWNYHDEEDNLVGYDVEVGKLIGEKLGVEVQFEECEWDAIFAGIDAGRYDMAIASVTVTDERKEKYAFSDPYAYMKTVVIVNGDNEDITSMEDLEGKVTANTISSTYAQIAESFGAEVTAVDDLGQTIELLLNNRCDATLNADVTFYDYMNAHPEANVKIACAAEDVEVAAIP